MRAAATKAAISAGLLRPASLFDSARHIDPKGPHGLNGGRHIVHAAGRPPGSAATLLPACSLGPVGSSRPVRSRAPSYRKRRGGDSRAGEPLRSTGRIGNCRGTRSTLRSLMSVCQPSGWKSRTISSSSACGGCRVTATHSARPRATAARRAACTGGICRGEGENTKPMASTPASSAAADRGRVGEAADLEPRRERVSRHVSTTAGGRDARP